MTGHPWPWWALIALATAVLAVPTIAIITLRERALGPILATAVAGVFLAELLERRLARLALALRIAGAFRCWRCQSIGDLDNDLGGIVYSAPKWVVLCKPCLASTDSVEVATA